MFFGLFKSIEDVIIRFEIEPHVLNNCTVIFAHYEDECYNGQAFVLFVKDGKIFEVNGNHCSCYGLEDQWEPEETTREALLHRIENGTLGEDRDDNGVAFRAELKALLLS